MTLSLENAPVYDIESFPNCFLLSAEPLNSDQCSTWEISHYRDDRRELFAWVEYLRSMGIPMIGFNNLFYDYRMLHYLLQNPNVTVEQLYDFNNSIFASQDRFGGLIWERDRIVPQIDLFKLHHFDNRAKTTSLKALQINMRSRRVLESRVPFGTYLTQEQINNDVVPYNVHDVKETKRFTGYSRGALDFRIGLIGQFGLEVLNYNDTKIGEKMLEDRLGEDVCYARDANGRKSKRQTIRRSIALRDIIFPYIKFDNPEFQRILDFKLQQVLAPEDLTDPEADIKTKGAYKISAQVGGLEFHFGTGGVHASVERKVFVADDNWLIRDIDVEGLYPNVAIANNLAPAHLGERFIVEYAKIPAERSTHAKGTYMNAAFKLAANGAWGKSNSKFSVFYDAQYAMTIPINGQLMICMLAEKLVTIPTLTLIQANTDGITYRIHKDYEPWAIEYCRQWQELTRLKLEDANYSKMSIRDVNNYIAVDTKGKLKQKGCYWHPDPLDYDNSISNASPPCWHKDFNPVVVPRAAVAAMVHGIDPAGFIRAHTNPFDFMCRAKVDRSSRLEIDGQVIQSTSRYYVAVQGGSMTKISPPPADARPGAFKRKNGVSLAAYTAAMEAGGWQWNAEVCTGNKSIYEDRRTGIEAGWKVVECNDADDFSFDNINYDYYTSEAMKLIVT